MSVTIRIVSVLLLMLVYTHAYTQYSSFYNCFQYDVNADYYKFTSGSTLKEKVKNDMLFKWKGRQCPQNVTDVVAYLMSESVVNIEEIEKYDFSAFHPMFVPKLKHDVCTTYVQYEVICRHSTAEKDCMIGERLYPGSTQIPLHVKIAREEGFESLRYQYDLEIGKYELRPSNSFYVVLREYYEALLMTDNIDVLCKHREAVSFESNAQVYDIPDVDEFLSRFQN